MKLKNRMSSFAFLLLFLAGLLLPMPVSASEAPYSIRIEANPSSAGPGEAVVLTVYLEGYDDTTKPELMGVQVNVFGMTDEMNLRERKSLIPSHNWFVNKTSYNKSNHSLVLLYTSDRFVNEGEKVEYLPRTTTGLVKGTITMPASAADAASLDLPVQVIMTDTASKSYTIKTTLSIPTGSEQPEVDRVEIKWDSMHFDYSPGTWNPSSLQYEGAGWSSQGGNVEVTNRSQKEQPMSIRYKSLLEAVSGTIVDEAGNAIEKVQLAPDLARTFQLKLEGKPDKELHAEKIGELTITIGGE